GRLVGKPVAKWFTEMGANVRVLTKESKDIAQYTKQADIIVCGAGASGFLKPDMIKEGVIILDAGTSEEGGVLRGDADPLCSEKAALMTPVPNGIGPVTIAMLLKNLVLLAEQHRG
ncbi:MAG: bifunctional 5,10-methylenetetrahydrofolate dehydrogenase/5,10-methenyltetrahydrofolate cyclohydrolase, partial [Candidatus Paceibacterota bacterium]